MTDSLDKLILHASEHCDFEGVMLALAAGARPNALESNRKTPLHHAVNHRSVDVAALLLQHGADVDAKDNQEKTPLHYAASRGHAGMVALLLKHGASPHSADEHRNTPLELVMTWHPENAELIGLLARERANGPFAKSQTNADFRTRSVCTAESRVRAK